MTIQIRVHIKEAKTYYREKYMIAKIKKKNKKIKSR